MSLNIVKTLALDFTREAPLEYIFVKAGDKDSRVLDITPLNSGLPYTIPAGVKVVFAAKKPDKTEILNDASINTKTGHIEVTLSEQTLAAEGILVCEVGLYSANGEFLSSQHFYLKASPFAITDVASGNEYNTLVVALLSVDEKIREAEKAIANANAATSAANTATTSANAAAELANAKAAIADEKATEANNVNISAAATETGADITVTDRHGVKTTVHIDTLTAVKTWEDVRNAVRLGIAPTLFPVGYEFNVQKMGSGTITFVVRGHNHHAAANKKLSNTMTLEMKNVYGTSNAYKGLIFDAEEALYYAETELTAGTYHFTLLEDYDTTYGGGKTLSFTLTKPVPAGGVIVFPWAYNTQSTVTKISTYESNTATVAIESVSVTEEASGTNLGTADGKTTNMNHTHRMRYGSNNYAQSAIRQWLNSDAALGAVWTPKTIFDRPPSWHTGTDAAYSGFMNGIEEDFLEVVQPSIIPCRTNSIFEVNSLDGTEFAINQTYEIEDKFFLLSRPEIYGTWDSSTYKDGELLEYYEGLTNEEKKKFDFLGSARSAWLRSPSPTYALSERYVNPDGTLYGNSANTSIGAAAACIIA